MDLWRRGWELTNDALEQHISGATHLRTVYHVHVQVYLHLPRQNSPDVLAVGVFGGFLHVHPASFAAQPHPLRDRPGNVPALWDIESIVQSASALRDGDIFSTNDGPMSRSGNSFHMPLVCKPATNAKWLVRLKLVSPSLSQTDAVYSQPSANYHYRHIEAPQLRS